MKNIFTAQKTVLALAVAGLISSGAFAATQNAVTIQEGSSLVIKNEAYTATGNVITNKDTGAKWAAGDTLGGESVVTLTVLLAPFSTAHLVLFMPSNQ